MSFEVDWGPLVVEFENEIEGEPRLAEEGQEPRVAVVREAEKTIKELTDEEE